jgi:hypothetical protein
MSGKSALKTAIRVGSAILPDIVSWVGDLIEAGMSPDEAEEVVKRDIESRRAVYQRERDADLAALDAKWDDETPTGEG